MEGPAGRDSGQRLDISALDLPRSFPYLTFPDDGACVWTEGDTAATAGLEVNHSHAEVIRVACDLHLQVDSLAAAFSDDVCTKPAPEVGNLIRMCHGCDLPAAKG